MKITKSLFAPFVRQGDTVRSMMSDGIIALLPAAIWGVYAFGARALVILLLSIFSCVAIEWIAGKLIYKKNTLPNLSAVMEGMVFALILPVGIPLYLVPLGALLAVGVAKCAFGGLGKNIFNPALFAHALLCLLFPESMRFFVEPFTKLSPFSLTLSDSSEGIKRSATLLEEAANGLLTDDIHYSDLITGSVPGGIGSVSALLILAGLLYLLVRRITSLHIPLFFVGTVAALSYLFPHGLVAREDFVLLSLLSGGTLFAAVFLTTDPTTSPMTTPGKILYAVFCGAALVLFRRFAGEALSLSLAVLAANLISRLLDLPFHPRPYGTKRDALVRGRESLADYLKKAKSLAEKFLQKNK